VLLHLTHDEYVGKHATTQNFSVQTPCFCSASFDKPTEDKAEACKTLDDVTFYLNTLHHDVNAVNDNLIYQTADLQEAKTSQLLEEKWKYVARKLDFLCLRVYLALLVLFHCAIAIVILLGWINSTGFVYCRFKRTALTVFHKRGKLVDCIELSSAVISFLWSFENEKLSPMQRAGTSLCVTVSSFFKIIMMVW